MSDKRHNSVLVEAVRVRWDGANEGVRPKPCSFVEQILSGAAEPDDINDFVEQWHTRQPSGGLAEFLGFTAAEYARWVEEPESLEALLDERRKRRAKSRKLTVVPA